MVADSEAVGAVDLVVEADLEVVTRVPDNARARSHSEIFYARAKRSVSVYPLAGHVSMDVGSRFIL